MSIYSGLLELPIHNFQRGGRCRLHQQTIECGNAPPHNGKNQFGLLTVGRLAYLNGVPSKPAPTRDYSSKDALARNIRRRTSVKSANGVAKFGPLFGLRKNKCTDELYQNPQKSRYNLVNNYTHHFFEILI